MRGLLPQQKRARGGYCNYFCGQVTRSSLTRIDQELPSAVKMNEEEGKSLTRSLGTIIFCGQVMTIFERTALCSEDEEEGRSLFCDDDQEDYRHNEDKGRGAHSQ